jgi:hypothetical protein
MTAPVFTLPFGKFKGSPITDASLGYLEWLLTLENLRDATRRAVEAEIARRKATAPTTMPAPSPRVVVNIDAEVLIEAGAAALRQKYPGAEPAIALVVAELRAGLVAF